MMSFFKYRVIQGLCPVDSKITFLTRLLRCLVLREFCAERDGVIMSIVEPYNSVFHDIWLAVGIDIGKIHGIIGTAMSVLDSNIYTKSSICVLPTSMDTQTNGIVVFCDRLTKASVWK